MPGDGERHRTPCVLQLLQVGLHILTMVCDEQDANEPTRRTPRRPLRRGWAVAREGRARVRTWHPVTGLWFANNKLVQRLDPCPHPEDLPRAPSPAIHQQA